MIYKSNKQGTLFAAYAGTCRVGYIECRTYGWRWQLSLVMPGGGHGFGIEDSEAGAKEELEKAFQFWIASAKLKEQL